MPIPIDLVVVLLFSSVGVFAFLPFAGRQTSWPPCDPISPLHCSVPFPSNFFAISSPTTATGIAVNLSTPMLPFTKNSSRGIDGGINVDTLRLNRRDGFSVGGPIVFQLTETPSMVASSSVLATWKNISLSLNAATSPTLLVDVNSKTLVPHWFEVDHRSDPLSGSDPSLMIYPAQMLTTNTRYLVIIRRLLSSTSGGLISASKGFAALRDNTTSSASDASLRDRQAEFNAFFEFLSLPPFNLTDRSAVQLMWDFTTESVSSQLDRFLHMKADALTRRIPADGPKFYVTKTELVPNLWSSAYVYGQLQVPLYLNSKEPGGTLVLNETTGLPIFQGFANASFMISVPSAVLLNTSTRRASWLQVGHGLFGSYTTVRSPQYQELGDVDGPYFIGSVSWWGLCQKDEAEIAVILGTDLSNFITVPDRLTQSLINHITLTKFFKSGRILEIPLLANVQKDRIDFSRTFYTGQSLGGIMGATLTTASPDIDKAVVVVDGSPFGLLLPRAHEFDALWDIIVLRGYDVVDRMVLISLFSYLLDVATPAAFLPHSTNDPLPGNKPKQFIMQHGLSDASVTYLGAQVSARTVGAVRFANSVFEEGEDVFGLPTINVSSFRFPKGHGGALFQTFSFHNPPIPFDDIPVEKKYSTHGCIGKDARALAALEKFFLTDGEIENFCAADGCHRPLFVKCG